MATHIIRLKVTSEDPHLSRLDAEVIVEDLLALQAHQPPHMALPLNQIDVADGQGGHRRADVKIAFDE